MTTKNESSRTNAFLQVGVCLVGWVFAATLGAMAWTYIGKQREHIEKMEYRIQHKEAAVQRWKDQQQLLETEAEGVR